MSCRRARRELLWLVRFGEFDAGSAPHLEHLAGCRPCRDEVGLNRALVRQLRTALEQRVADASPSPTAWEGVLARMRQPEPQPAGLRGWATRIVAGLRAGTAMAGASLALLLALNLEVVPVAPVQSDEEARPASPPAWAGDIPPFVEVAPPAATPPAVPEDDGVSLVQRQASEAELLPLGRAAAAATLQPPDSEAPADEEEPSAEDDGWQILVRLVPGDAARISGTTTSGSDEPAEPEVPAPERLSPVPGPS